MIAGAYVAAGAFVLLLSAYFLYLACRYPHLRRLAWRNVRAQRLTALLTALGLTASTALVSMTLIANASLSRSAEITLERHYGPVSYDAPSTDQPRLSDALFDRRGAAAAAGGRLERALPVVSVAATAIRRGGEGEAERLVPHVHMLGFDRGEALRFDPGLRALLPEALRPGEAVLAESAAARLGAAAGEEIVALDRENREVRFRVARVVPERGVAGYRGVHGAVPAAIVALEDARRLAGIEGETFTNVLLSEPAADGWRAAPVRDEAAKQYRDAAGFVSAVFGLTSANAVLIGIVLMANIFRLIAEERKQEMGILRAVGLGRRELGRVLRMEGMLYGFVSGLLGVALGWALAYALTETIGRAMLETFSDKSATSFRFVLDPRALLAGFAIGLATVSACVWLISRRAARASVVEALRPAVDAARPARRKSLASLWLFGVSGIAAAALLAATAFPGIRRAVVDEERIGLVLMTTLFAVPLFVLVSLQAMGPLCAGAERLFRRSARGTLLLRLAFRNLNANRGRTALIALMFAAISCFVSFPIVYQAALHELMTRSDPRASVGGYDLLARDARPLEAGTVATGLTAAGLDGERDGFATEVVLQLHWKTEEGEWGPFAFMANGIDAAFAASNDIALASRDPRFADDRAAWEAVARDASAVIVSEDAIQYERAQGRAYAVGDRFRFRIEGGGEASKTIAGIARTAGYHPESYGVWLRRDALAELAKHPRDLRSTVLVKLERPGDAEVKRSLVRALSLQNVSPVVDVAASENDYYATGGYLIRLFMGFNQLALLIGMLGLTVVMHRLVRQRRQQIGMLRASGATAGDVGAAVALEGAIVCVFGVALGYGVGTYMSYVVFDTLISKESGTPLALPWGALALYFGATVAAAVSLAWLPARKALRVSPAEATRYVG